jgi:hypothetical protein
LTICCENEEFSQNNVSELSTFTAFTTQATRVGHNIVVLALFGAMHKKSPRMKACTNISTRRFVVFWMVFRPIVWNLPMTHGFVTPSIAASTNSKKTTTSKVSITPIKTTTTDKNKSFVDESSFLSIPSTESRLSMRIAEATSIKDVATMPQESNPFSSFSKLRQISNVASFLCVLDCTLLPIITIAFPLVGFVNLGATEWLDDLGHSLALYFVLPVGGLTALVNYLSHKQKWITSLAFFGLILIGLSNSQGITRLPLVDLFEFLPTLQHGSLHRVVNCLGCTFLLASNYLSQQQQDCACSSDCTSQYDHNNNMKMNNSMARSIQYRQHLAAGKKSLDE